MNRHFTSSKVRAWILSPLSPEVAAALDRLASVDDVVRVAVMPDVHLAEDVCIGTVVATKELLLPSAVGGDIGCGVAAVAFDAVADLLANEQAAASVLSSLYRTVPAIRHPSSQVRALPSAIADAALSNESLERLKARDGTAEFGTLGRGNHFVEFQSDTDRRLWLMVHSGSRAMGQAIRDHHVRSAKRVEPGFAAIPADDVGGAAYLNDVAWAVAYAEANRRSMSEAVAAFMKESFGGDADWSTFRSCDHNHVRREVHGGGARWVHRKGAISAAMGEPGIIPGSMGSESHHVEGRGLEEALTSSSHGAGRAMSRTDARRNVSARRMRDEMGGVWFDQRLTQRLRDEAPSAYKDIREVMRAQHELTRILRTLRPVLSFKGA